MICVSTNSGKSISELLDEDGEAVLSVVLAVVLPVDWDGIWLRLQDMNEDEVTPATRKRAMIFFIFADSFLHLFFYTM